MDNEELNELNTTHELPSEESLGDYFMQKNKNVEKKLYGSMLKVGFIAFGGGTSTIPIFEKSCVEKDKLISKDDFTDEIVVANITPGAVPIKLGCGIGMQTKGVFGGYFSSMLVSLPGMLLTIILVSLLGLMGAGVIKYLGFASIGVTVFVIYLMVSFVTKTIKNSKKENNLAQVLIIIGITFLLTVGGKISGFISGLIGKDFSYSAYFSISVLQIIIACFYVILFNAGKVCKAKGFVCAVVLVYYFIVVGKNKFLSSLDFTAYLLMVLSLIINGGVTLYDRNGKSKTQRKSSASEVASDIVVKSKVKPSENSLYSELKPALKIALIYLVSIVLYTVFLMLIDLKNAKVVLDYCLKGCLSVFSTFGGGAIYYPVAEGVFVDSGLITSQVFNVELMTVVNALPGPVLVKMLASIGYKIGFSIAGSMLTGYLYSFLGLFIAVGLSSLTFAVIYIIFKHYGKLAIFGKIRNIILPAICGVLFSTIISMLSATFTAGEVASVKGYVTLLVVAVLYFAVHMVSKKTKLPEIATIIGGGSITLGLYSIIMLF